MNLSRQGALARLLVFMSFSALAAYGCNATTQGSVSGASPPPGQEVAPERAKATAVSSNEDGEWRVTVFAAGRKNAVDGFVAFAGPAGKTRQMGMCIVQRYEDGPQGVSCGSVDDCGAAPAELPDGGSRYCVAPGGRGESFCHFRPGDRETYCAGSPALEFAAIPPGSYSVSSAARPGTRWLAIACFEGCENTPRIVSATATALQ